VLLASSFFSPSLITFNDDMTSESCAMNAELDAEAHDVPQASSDCVIVTSPRLEEEASSNKTDEDKQYVINTVHKARGMECKASTNQHHHHHLVASSSPR
jgi:hypothetical protein